MAGSRPLLAACRLLAAAGAGLVLVIAPGAAVARPIAGRRTSVTAARASRPQRRPTKLAQKSAPAARTPRRADAGSGRSRREAERLARQLARRAAKQARRESREATRGGNVAGTTSGAGSEGAGSGGAPTAPGSTGGKDVKEDNLPAEAGETLLDPIDERFLTDLPFGMRSFWLQPWRSYFDTWPASRLTEAIGIDFHSNGADAEDIAHLLHDSGYKLARTEVPWADMSYADPTELTERHLARVRARLSAMVKWGLRPLIVLNANSGAPAPAVHPKLETLQAVPAGATKVRLSPASAAVVVLGKTGFNGVTFGGAPDDLITSVSANGTATLSRPLLVALAAGQHNATTLRYAPFEAPTLTDGSPNPTYEETMGGWLSYVRAVSRLAESVAGPGGYDIEIWNELSFGSQFLNAGHYYREGTEDPSEGTGDGEGEAEQATEEVEDGEAEAEEEMNAGQALEPSAEPFANEGVLEEAEQAAALAHGQLRAVPARDGEDALRRAKRAVTKAVIRALRDETVALIRNPAEGFSPNVQITDGFASESPFPSGATAPLGLDALSKHPYTTGKVFPGGFHEGHGRPVNALGGVDTSSRSSRTPLFVPAFQSLFPEYWLTGMATETLTRDLAPFQTMIYKAPHGRKVGPPGGPPLQKWVTEFDMTPGATVMGPDEKTPVSGPSATLTTADREHFQAKVMLRSYVADVSKGMAREYGGDDGLDVDGFYEQAEANPSVYPGDAAGGEMTTGIHNLLSQFTGPGPEGPTRQLTLESIAQQGDHAQFEGDGTPEHPSLYDRDVLAVFPFQSSPTRFAIPVYVMTRDLLTDYEPWQSDTDIHRFDLPDEKFDITLGNLPETAAPPVVRAYDPLLETYTPASLVSRSGASATFQIAATDYPRVLTLEY